MNKLLVEFLSLIVEAPKKKPATPSDNPNLPPEARGKYTKGRGMYYADPEFKQYVGKIEKGKWIDAKVEPEKKSTKPQSAAPAAAPKPAPAAAPKPASTPAAKAPAKQAPAPKTTTAAPTPEDENPVGKYDANDSLQRSVVEAKTKEELYTALDELGEDEARLMYDEVVAGAGGPVASAGETMCTEAQTDLIQGRYNSEQVRSTPQFQSAMNNVQAAFSGTKGKRPQTSIKKELDEICLKFGLFTPQGKPDYDAATPILAEAHTYVMEKDATFKETNVAKQKFKTEEDRFSWLRASFYASYSLMNNGPSDWDRANGNGRVLKANSRTDGVVKKLLEDKLESARKVGDVKQTEYYQRELESWEKFRGYHDTYLVYTNKDGNLAVYHISNKKSDDLLDPQHNTTPEKRIRTYDESAREANLSPEQAKIVGDAQQVAVSAVQNIDAIAVAAYNELDAESVPLIASLASRLPRKSQTDVSRDYFESLKNDRIMKKHFKSNGINPDDLSDEDIIVTAMELVEQSGGKLETFSGNFSKFVIKLGQLSRSVYDKAEAGKSPEEISKMFNGIYTPEEITEILNDPEMKMLADVKTKHAAGLEGVHQGFIDALHKADGTDANHTGDNGPAVETYVRGTLKALHIDTYITNYDNKVQIEMGGVGVVPSDVRGCMGRLSGFKGSTDTPAGRQNLIDHLAKSVKLDSGSDAVYLVGEDGKTRTYLATDTWRQAGSGQKIATGFGADLRKCLKSSVAKRLATSPK